MNLLESDQGCFNCNIDESGNTKISDLEQSILKWKHILLAFENNGCLKTAVQTDISTPTKIKENPQMEDEIMLQIDQPGCSKWKISNFSIIPNILLSKKHRNDSDENDPLKENSFLKNTLCTASLKSKFFSKDKETTKSSITPLRFLNKKTDNPREISLNIRELDPKDRVISPKQKHKALKNVSPVRLLEDHLLKITSVFPNRRSSTPTAVFKTNSNESEGHSSIKSKNDGDCCEEVIKKVDLKLKNILNINNYISGRKSAEPRMDSINREKFLRPICNKLEYQAKLAESVPGIPGYFNDVTPDKFSLINYDKLPSVKALERESQLNLERQSSQLIYVSGKIIKEKGYFSHFVHCFTLTF